MEQSPKPPTPKPQPAHRTGWSSSLKLPFKSKNAFSFLPSPRFGKKGTTPKGPKSSKSKSKKSSLKSPNTPRKSPKLPKKSPNLTPRLAEHEPPLINSPTPWADRKLITAVTTETQKSEGTIDTTPPQHTSSSPNYDIDFVTPTKIKPVAAKFRSSGTGFSESTTTHNTGSAVECIMGSPDLFLIHGPSTTPNGRPTYTLPRAGSDVIGKDGKKRSKKKVTIGQNFLIETASVAENLSDISNVSSPTASVKIGKNYMIETEGFEIEIEDEEDSFRSTSLNPTQVLGAPPELSYEIPSSNLKDDSSYRSFGSLEPLSNANIVTDNPNKTLLTAISSISLPPTTVVYYAPSPPPPYWATLKGDLETLPPQTYTILITHHPHEATLVPLSVETSSVIKIVGEVDDRYERVIKAVKGFVGGQVEDGEATVRYIIS